MNRLLLFSLILCGTGTYAQDNAAGKNHPGEPSTFTYTLSGCDSTFVDGEKIYLWSYHQNRQQEWIDSAVVANHCFLIKAALPYEQDVVYAYKGVRREVSEQITGSFVIEEGNLRMEPGGNGMFRVVGSPANDSICSFSNSFSSSKGKYDAEEISRHAAVMALWLIDCMSSDLSKSDIEYVLDRLPQAYREHPSVRGWRVELSQAKADVGLPYADITGVTLSGDTLSLSTIVDAPANKYVLVDFGAAWCGGCRVLTKELVPIYKQLRAKGVEVFGVSYDVSRSSWSKYVEDSGSEWPQVNLGFGVAPRDTRAWKDYRLSGIPATFLIDCATGIIVAKNVTEETLASILQPG